MEVCWIPKTHDSLENQHRDKQKAETWAQAEWLKDFLADYGLLRLVKMIPQALNLLVHLSSEGKCWAGGSVWYERRLRKAEVAGSNPARSIPFKFKSDDLYTDKRQYYEAWLPLYKEQEPVPRFASLITAKAGRIHFERNELRRRVWNISQTNLGTHMHVWQFWESILILWDASMINVAPELS